MVSLYDDFEQEWMNSCSFRALVIIAILIGLGMLIGGLCGIYYTPYKDSFSIVFEVGLLYCIALAFLSIILCIGYCRSED
jgi:hypothetical protein